MRVTGAHHAPPRLAQPVALLLDLLIEVLAAKGAAASQSSYDRALTHNACRGGPPQ